MSDFLALGGTIAIWLAISFALWLGRRFWIRSRQNRRLKHAASAAQLVRRAGQVFDTIRTPSPPDTVSTNSRAYLRSETHALLARIQQQGGYFDQVNSLRVNIQAVIGVEDHKGLSDILDLRRDLWAGSEIVLVEDPAQFGRTFADEGSFERLQAEAVRTLFKFPELTEAGEDVIGLRVALAIQEADHFEAELAAAVAEARERDRLPTPAELAAYPVGWVKKIPPVLAAIAAFARAFYAQASEMSRRIRGSETVTRGTARMRQIGEDWPQRLSDGLQRATVAARDNAVTLRKHYEFLAAAHDFKGKYQTLIQRAPELSDRSRQFISRLELAERSERLRLTSANAAIWAVRKAVDGLAHVIAFLRNIYARLQATPPYALASAMLAPAPVRGRRIPVFRSYRRALAANGLHEPVSRPVLLIAEVPKAAGAGKRTKSTEGKRLSGKTEKQRRPRKSAEKRSTKRAKRENAVASKKAPKAPRARKPEKKIEPAAPAQAKIVNCAVSELASSPASSERQSAGAKGKKRGSFLGRMFRSRSSKDGKVDHQSDERLNGKLQDVQVESDTSSETGASLLDDPIEPAISLLDKLTSIDETEDMKASDQPIDAGAGADSGATVSEAQDTEEEAGAFAPLTQSLMELQGKAKPSTPQIKAFPWLRH